MGGADQSIDSQTGFGGDNGQQEMGWTGSAVDTSSAPGPSESPVHIPVLSPVHSAPRTDTPAYVAPQRPEEAPARLSEPPGNFHAPVAPAPDHRPQVAWPSTPPATPANHGAEGPPRED